MKLYMILSLTSLAAVAAPCEVGGISDSPQRMECYISHHRVPQKLILSCVRGRYSMDWMGRLYAVGNAYHEDVERGSSPLVFDGGEIVLTTISQRIYSTATLEISGKPFQGMCFDQKATAPAQ